MNLLGVGTREIHIIVFISFIIILDLSRTVRFQQQLLSFVFKSKTSFEHFVARPTKTEKSVVLTMGYR